MVAAKKIAFLVVLVAALIAVAFYTLLERKVLGYIQWRKGPNKVGVWGILTPFGDGVKLFTKSMNFSLPSNMLLFCSAPVFTMGLGLSLFVLFPGGHAFFGNMLWVLVFFCISSLSVYGVLFTGWASNSIYAFLGAVRSSAQAISYEVCMFLLILFPFLVLCQTHLTNVSFSVGLVFSPLVLMWMMVLLAETNRAPFDFAEGESELVSGFNVEMSSSFFAVLFLGEYASMLILSFISGWLLFGGLLLLGQLAGMLFTSGFLVSRAGLPRFRYDLMMGSCWKTILPLSLALLVFSSLLF